MGTMNIGFIDLVHLLLNIVRESISFIQYFVHSYSLGILIGIYSKKISYILLFL